MIYLVRHGEAAAGWGQHPDPGLSEKGQAQAAGVADILQNKGIDHGLTSPMQRCQDTAAPFAATASFQLNIEPRVTEIPTPTGIEDRIDWLRNLMSGNWADTEELIKNWRRTLIETLSALPENTVVFSHFIAINAIVGHLEGSDAVTVFRPDHCSITQIQPSKSGLKLFARGKEAGTKVL